VVNRQDGMAAGPLRVAVVTDIHHGPPSLTKKGDDALPLLRSFCDFVATEAPDFVVDLGDRITDVDARTDRGLMAEVAETFAAIGVPRAHLIGNHDVAHLSIADNETAFARSLRHAHVELRGWNLVFWQVDCRLTWPDGFARRQDDLDWLRQALAASALPTVVFTHVPLDSASLAGNYWFQNNPRFAALPHADEAREIIQAAGNVVLCVAGHVHRNHVSVIDGVRYITVQSLTESYATNDRAAGAWAILELDDEIRWRTHGDDYVEMRQPLRGRNQHWPVPLPDFQRLRAQRQAARGLAEVKGLLLDMDGVLYRGRSPVPGAADAVARLTEAGLALACVTNNARHSAEDYADRLRDIGIAMPADRIVTSGQAVARHLGGRVPAPAVMVVGSPALREAVLAAGCRESTNPAVVVAGACDHLDQDQLTRAVRHLIDGAELIGSNADAVIPTEGGAEPEAGPVVAYLETAAGCRARVLGKPDPAIFELALSRLGLPAEAVLMVGDSPGTDVAGADAAGLRSVLVETGNPIPATASAPTFRFRDLAALADALLNARVAG